MGIMIPLVVRTWKRDGSTNTMQADFAAFNLRQNGCTLSPREIVAALAKGEVFETRHAWFGLFRHDPARTNGKAPVNHCGRNLSSVPLGKDALFEL